MFIGDMLTNIIFLLGGTKYFIFSQTMGKSLGYYHKFDNHRCENHFQYLPPVQAIEVV